MVKNAISFLQGQTNTELISFVREGTDPWEKARDAQESFATSPVLLWFLFPVFTVPSFFCFQNLSFPPRQGRQPFSRELAPWVWLRARTTSPAGPGNEGAGHGAGWTLTETLPASRSRAGSGSGTRRKERPSLPALPRGAGSGVCGPDPQTRPSLTILSLSPFGVCERHTLRSSELWCPYHLSGRG